MKSIFEESSYNEIIVRINALNNDSKALWGKMDVGQMVWHCQAPLNIILKKNDYGMKPNWFAKVFFKKSLYNDSPWHKNLPTSKMFKPKEAKDFVAERTKLIALIDELNAHSGKTDWDPHPAFGYFTKDQWGQMQYKHLDHHLRQFGV